MNLPNEFLGRMKALLGDKYDDYIKALDEQPQRAFRVNTKKISLTDFDKINDLKSEKMPFVDSGYYLFEEKVGGHPFHHAGIIYVQEPAAMMPAECVEIEEDWRVLDMCASPGGKSTQILAKLGDEGVLVSNEIVFSRTKILGGNMERMGAKNTVVTCADTAELASFYPDCFNLVCVDAPCSGEGMMRKEPQAAENWSMDNVLLCAERQKEILHNASVCVAPGGYIIYATCTFSPEENEMVIDSFLSEHPDFELCEVPQKIKDVTADGITFDGCKSDKLNRCRRFYPHLGRGEGQFMAVLKNTSDGERNEPTFKSCLKKCDDKIMHEFLGSTLTDYDKEHILLHKDVPVYFTPAFPVPPKLAFTVGVTIGEVKKNYILPHHAFYMAFGKDFKRKLNLSINDDRLTKFLHGETLITDTDNGFCSVMCEGASTGGGKSVNGTLKNHYPKGLRLVK